MLRDWPERDVKVKDCRYEDLAGKIWADAPDEQITNKEHQ